MELSKKERREMKRDERQSKMLAEKRTLLVKKISKWIFGVFIFLAAVYGVFLYFRNNLPSDDITSQCVAHGSLGMHIHPVLQIVVSGRPENIPANIGIPSPQCMRPLHTHDATGTIHIESKLVRDFYLKEFFVVWGQTFNRDQILGHKTDAGHRIRMTVNGNESQEFENLIMKDKDEIAIYYEEIE